MPLPIELSAVAAAAEPSVAVRPPLAWGSLTTVGAASGHRSVYPFGKIWKTRIRYYWMG